MTQPTPKIDINNLLIKAGIYPHGSEECLRYEARMERALVRSYKKAIRQQPKLDGLETSSKAGPIAEETERLMLSHYDERAELFSNFLDTSFMAYSMAYYGRTADEIENCDTTLEQAQQAKFELFCKRAQLSGKEKIFNLGCGFGSLEKFLLQKYPEMTVVGLTPSKVQANYLRAKIDDRGNVLGDGRFQLIESDFESLDLTEVGMESFDAVFSVGVLEHLKNLEVAFKKMASMLKPGGVAFHHLIASYHAIPRFMDTKKTRIDQYFPGGRVWPFAELEGHTEHFSLEKSWYINGLNYWRTLDEWHRRFWSNIESISDLLDFDNIRHWNDYFSLCKIVFSPLRGEIVGNGQYFFKKR